MTVFVNVIVLPNNNPKVNLDYWPADQYVNFNNTRAYNYGTWFEYTVHPESFWDPLNNNWEPKTMCEQSNSQPLPDWLQYSDANYTVYGWADTEGVWSIDCTFFDDQGKSIYFNYRIVVRENSFDWLYFFILVALSLSAFFAVIIYFVYMWDYHTRGINKNRLKRLNFKIKVVKAIEDRFRRYRDIELKFYLPDPADDYVLKNHQKPVELEDFNFNESNADDYFENVWMLNDT